MVRLLRSSRLCFLSTFCDDHPHLSLMNFTYHPGGLSAHSSSALGRVPRENVLRKPLWILVVMVVVEVVMLVRWSRW